MIRISIPPTLRRFFGGEDVVHVSAQTVTDAIDQMQGRFHGVRDRLCREDGRIRGSVLVFVNDQDIRFLDEQNTTLQPGDEVTIIPAFAGG
ncbi:MAG: MoaD/ThiS family protein [Limisphaerales bacterium]|jgi:molybdopterin synthase sulfur carrier subunit